MDRRKVLALGAAGAAWSFAGSGFATLPGSMRTIPSTGALIPTVGLGTWITFNVGNDPVLLERSVAVMRAFFEEGGGMIDTSPMYGSAQATIGHGLKALGRQKTLFSADKIWTSSVNEGEAQFNQAKRDWGVQSFDLLQVHNLVAAEGHLANLLDRKANGQIAYVGLTTSHGRRHGDLERLMKAHPLDFVQLTYNVLDREAEARLLPLARDLGIAIIVNRPFQRGALIRRTQGIALPDFAAEIGAKSWAELMLRFVLSHDAVTVAIPATTRPEHVRQNKSAARRPLLDEKMRTLVSEAVAEL